MRKSLVINSAAKRALDCKLTSDWFRVALYIVPLKMEILPPKTNTPSIIASSNSTSEKPF